jgi:hypothetical protein
MPLHAAECSIAHAALADISPLLGELRARADGDDDDDLHVPN